MQLESTQRRVVGASLAGVFISLVPYLLVVASLPEIAADLDTTETTLGWVLTAPLLASAVLLTSFGRLGDLFGHRRVFLAGLSVSGLFAVLAALAWDPISLIAFRTVSQVAGSATGPTAIALVISAVDERARPRVLGQWAFVMGIAPAIGLLVGGPAVDAVGWRGLFAMQAALVGVVLPLCFAVLRETPRRPHVSFDVPGSVAFMLLSGSLVFAVDRAGKWGWDHPAVVLSIALLPIAAVFLRYAEKRADDPIVPLSVMRDRGYVSSCACEFLIQVATNAALFVAPLLYHEHYGTSATRTALYLAPMPLGMAVTSPLGGWLTEHSGERRTAALGTVALVASLVAFVLGDEAGSIALVLLAWFAVGAANGLIRPAIASAAAAALAPANYGAGMATTRMISTAGSAVGITLAIGVLEVADFRVGLLAATAAALVSVASTVGLGENVATPAPSEVPAPQPSSAT